MAARGLRVKVALDDPLVDVVTACMNGWCPGQNIAFERAQRVAAELGDDVLFCLEKLAR